MSDNSSIFDNNTSTQRIINSGLSTQVFSNTQNDTSYSLDPTDTQDFFRLRLSQRSSLVLTLNSQSANADIALLDAGGTLQDSTNGGTLADTITTGPLAAGDYYIRVYLPDTTASTNYTLKVNTISTSRADVVWRNNVNGDNAIWLMNGTSLSNVLTNIKVSDLNWKVQGTGDFNGDGVPDYVWRNAVSGDDYVWIMNGNSFSSGTFLPAISDTNWNIAGIGDFDGDGQNDIVWRNYANGQDVLWLMNGLSLKSNISLTAVGDTTWRIAAVTDLSGDGRADLVWRNTQTGQNLAWVMNVNSISASVSLPTISDTTWNIVGAGDFNGDGMQDLLWRNSSTGTSVVWQMNKLSQQSILSFPSISDTTWSIVATVTAPPPVDLAGNTMGTALDIGALNASGSYADRIGGASDGNDYYKFSLSAPSVVNLSLTGLTAGTNADVQIIQDLDNSGSISNQSEVLAYSVNLSNADEQISNLTLGSGNYFIRVYSSSSQSSEYALNISGTTGQQIDLLPNTASPFTLTTTSNATLPTTVSLNSSKSNYLSAVKVNYSVKNNSTTVTPSSFRISFYLSRDNVITSTDYLFGTLDPNTGISSSDVTITNLAPNTSRTGSQTLTLPPATDSWWGGDQTYYIGMIIDSGSEVAESSEVNNTVSAAINIRDTIRPDVLGGGLVILQSSAAPSQAITLTGSVKNIGNISTGTGPFLVQFYFSNNDILDGGDTVIGTAYVGPVAALSSVSFDSRIGPPASGATRPPAYFTSTNIVLPDSTWEGWQGSGRYYIAMRIDPLTQVSEGLARDNNYNYGRVIGQYTDYDFIDITGAPNNQPKA